MICLYTFATVAALVFISTLMKDNDNVEVNIIFGFLTCKDMDAKILFTIPDSERVKGFAKRAAPLTKLARKGVEFSWGPTEKKSFADLKQVLTSHPILSFPAFTKHFHLLRMDVLRVQVQFSSRTMTPVVVSWRFTQGELSHPQSHDTPSPN